MTQHVLVGDVGGTNVRFGIAHLSGDGIEIDDFVKLPGDDFPGFEAALDTYCSQTGNRANDLPAVFALAGPPKGDTVSLTNRDWTVSAGSLRQNFGLSAVKLVNDFAAMARAVPEVNAEFLTQIKPGEPVDGAPIVVAGPGTGFGVSTLVPTGAGWTILSGEGGFMQYAPQTPIEKALHVILARRNGFVSNEHVCSGMGLDDVHQGLCEVMDRPYELTSPAEMLRLAEAGDELFQELCHIRARGVMGVAGDIVLLNGARGGVVLAGGVTERLVKYLTDEAAIERFTNRDKNTFYMQACPIHLMHDPEAPLLGAAALYLRDRTDAI